MSLQDQPIEQREKIDTSKLIPFLQQHVNLSQNITIQQFPSGYSNLTYLIRDHEREYILRRSPIGVDVKGGHDMGREYGILSKIYPHYSKVPKPILLCSDPEILGCEFYLMERVMGMIVRSNVPDICNNEEFFSNLSKQTVSVLAEIHNLNVEQIELKIGRPKGYVERQVSGWTRRFQRVDFEENEDMAFLSEWLHKNQPTEVGASLIHNDYKYDNLILDTKTFDVKAILDWEMATIGCPLMDMGAALGYWVEANDDERLRKLPFCPTFQQGNYTRREFAESYCELRGLSTQNLSFYIAYGRWRIAVILQQIYARYKKGLTTDERFATLGDGVKILAHHTRQEITS